MRKIYECIADMCEAEQHEMGRFERISVRPELSLYSSVLVVRFAVMTIVRNLRLSDIQSLQDWHKTEDVSFWQAITRDEWKNDVWRKYND